MPEVDNITIVSADASAPIATVAGRFGSIAARFAMVWVLLILVILTQILYPGFLAAQNVINLLSQNAPLGIIAVGMTFVLIAGGFDLSVGPVYAAGATFYATQANHWSLPLAALLTILVGCAAGLINGLIVTRLRVNAFVATLGTSSVFGGAAYLYSHSAPVLVSVPGFEGLGAGSWLGLPISVELLIAIYVVGGIVLAKTVYGRALYAVGGNPEAARLAGLRVGLLQTSTYMLVGVLAVLGGMIIASRLGLGQPDIAATMSLDAIAVVIIGGTSLFGGTGAVWRTAVGLLLLAVLTNLFDALALDSNFQQLIKGAIIVGAVALDARVNRR